MSHKIDGYGSFVMVSICVTFEVFKAALLKFNNNNNNNYNNI